MEPKASYYPETDTLIIATGETATFLASCGENGCVKVDLDNVEDQYVVGITLLGAAKILAHVLDQMVERVAHYENKMTIEAFSTRGARCVMSLRVQYFQEDDDLSIWNGKPSETAVTFRDDWLLAANITNEEDLEVTGLELIGVSWLLAPVLPQMAERAAAY